MNTFDTTAKKRRKNAEKTTAAAAQKETARLERQRAIDAKMQALHAEQCSTILCCTNCKQTLPLVMFGKDKSRKSGIAARCKPCNRLHVKGPKGYVKAERDPELVPARQINTMQGSYVPAQDTYYRNNGHKHIKSRGYQC